MRKALVSAAATRTANVWEITVRGIRNAPPFVHGHMMRLVKRPNFALPVAAFVLAAVAALGLLSIGGDKAEAGTTTTVFVNDSVFCGTAGSSCAQPFSIQITAGSTVEWVDGQAGAVAHTVTQCSGDGTGCPGGSPGFTTGILIDPTPNYLSQSFPDAGTFFYRCQVHLNFMRGIVEVVPVSVGGIADFPDIDQAPEDAPGSSEGSSFALTALVSGLVAALAMFAAGAWYARRRWLR